MESEVLSRLASVSGVRISPDCTIFNGFTTWQVRYNMLPSATLRNLCVKISHRPLMYVLDLSEYHSPPITRLVSFMYTADYGNLHARTNNNSFEDINMELQDPSQDDPLVKYGTTYSHIGMYRIAVRYDIPRLRSKAEDHYRSELTTYTRPILDIPTVLEIWIDAIYDSNPVFGSSIGLRHVLVKHLVDIGVCAETSPLLENVLTKATACEEFNRHLIAELGKRVG